LSNWQIPLAQDHLSYAKWLPILDKKLY
jgi:hypothetical protein